VRFDLRGLTGSLERATLRVHARGRVTVRPVADRARWSERRTTFSNAPRVTRPIVRSARLRGRWGRSAQETLDQIPHWRWPDRAPGLWLAGLPELQGQLADENAWP
jgi:hypothetical protein